MSSSKQKKALGLAFIIASAFFIKAMPCPTNIQKMFDYALIGTGITFLLYEVASHARVTIKSAPITIALRGGIASAFSLIIWDPVGHYKPDICQSNRVLTVIVHGDKSQTDLILKNRGSVVLYKNGRTPESIDSKGQASRSHVQRNW